MKTELSKSGNGLVVRIPKSVAVAAKLKTGDALDVDAEGSGSLRIRKPKRTRSRKSQNRPALQDLVSRITPENRHELVDWGAPVGKEVW
jgi:antitoxin MazE